MVKNPRLWDQNELSAFYHHVCQDSIIYLEIFCPSCTIDYTRKNQKQARTQMGKLSSSWDWTIHKNLFGIFGSLHFTQLAPFLQFCGFSTVDLVW